MADRTAAGEVLEHVFARYPHAARQAGRHEYDGCLPGPGVRWDTVEDRLAATVRRDLATAAGPESRADLDAAARLLELMRFETSEAGRVLVGPVDPLAEASVASYLRDPRPPLDALRAHLAGLPEFLDAEAALIGDRLSAGARMRCQENAIRQAARLRRLTDDPVVSGAAAAAAAACERFARAVAATTPVAGLLGPDGLAAYLTATEGLDQSVEDLFEEAADEVASMAAALDVAVAKIGAANPREAYQQMAAQVAPESLADAVTTAVEAARAFWADRDVVPIDVTTPVEIVIGPRDGASAEVVFDIGVPHRLVVPDLRDTHLDDATLAVVAVHETYAGHYVHTEAAFRGGSPLRSAVRWWAGFPEGWSHYAEELAVELGFAEGRPYVAVAQLRSALESAVRLHVACAVHLGRWGFAEAVERAAATCQWSTGRAVREVLLSTANLSTAMYTYGKLRIRRWRRELGGTSLRDFHARILRCGYAPLETVQRYWLDGL